MDINRASPNESSSIDSQSALTLNSTEKKKIFKNQITNKSLIAAMQATQEAETRAANRYKKLSSEEKERTDLKTRDLRSRMGGDVLPLTSEERSRAFGNL